MPTYKAGPRDSDTVSICYKSMKQRGLLLKDHVLCITASRKTLTWTPGNVLIQFLSRLSPDLGMSGKNRSQEDLWGVPFPSRKNVQNKHFYIILLTKNFRVIGFQFWDGRPCTDTP